ncbi:MAG TPA: hypothetical protein ENG62_01210 [Thermoplasmatales archaeon]|nr:hypothetical protein [Thermoplasmatales archaeon]
MHSLLSRYRCLSISTQRFSKRTCKCSLR